MGGARSHGQQVIVAWDVAVPGHVVRVLRIAGHRHAIGSQGDVDGRLWKKAAKRGSDAMWEISRTKSDNEVAAGAIPR